MSTLTAYEVSDADLVDRLIQTSAKAGTATSGLCFDPAAGIHISQMQYLSGAVRARMAGKKPPFHDGVRVVVGSRAVFAKNYRDPSLQPGREGVVNRVWYIGDDWCLELCDGEGLYPASAFKLATPKQEEAPVVVG